MLETISIIYLISATWMLYNLKSIIDLGVFTFLEQLVSSTGMKITTGMYIALFAIFMLISPVVMTFTLLRKIF